jgi:hypothetical protein
MLSVFESNVANGIGSMEIYNLKVKCTISCNVFIQNCTFSSMLLYIGLGSHYSSSYAISLLYANLGSR